MNMIQRPETRRRSRLWALAIVGAISTVLPTAASAQPVVSGSTGADGPFNANCTPTPCTVTVQLPPTGIFNYTTVNIHEGVTVRYARNQANTPVTILATGDVTIAGTIDVSGDDATGFTPGRGGPGAFDGGLGGTPAHLSGTAGLGPGGGPGGDPFVRSGGQAGYGTPGAGPNFEPGQGGPAYGVHTVFPLIGGSGGGGGAGGTLSDGPGGGGGGGAILIASSRTIDLTRVSFSSSAVVARGGLRTSLNVNPGVSSVSSGCGSGGAIRLIANTVIGGNGFVDARPACGGGTAGDGRIRLEFVQGSPPGAIPTASMGIPAQIPVVPGAAFPAVRITAVAGASVPPTQEAAFLAVPDISLAPTTPNPVVVRVAATNVPLGTVIAVTAVTEGFPNRVTVNSTPLTGTLASSTATASVTLPPGVSVLTATATFAAAP